ncbi:alpha/beta hydrolase [Sphaerochaeta sp.]|uniref:alpha/beta hydrolase n=1 Tax=Sphaerochaeta sp. TaxID=1972642 RepID=UPI002FC8B2CE
MIIILLCILFILWNTTLFGYRDKRTEPLEVDESKTFCDDAKSIIYQNHSDTAILLVHGFPSTPSIYYYSAKRFSEAGMDVYAPLLPGFGTDPKAFVYTTFTQWFAYLCTYYEQLRIRYAKLYVLGTSMGGMMTLKLGQTYCSTDLAPDKLVTIAAPVVYNSIKEGIFTDARQYAARTLALFTPAIQARTIQGDPNGEDGSEYWIGYGGLFVRAGLSLVHAMKQVRRDLPKITCPLFSIHDVNDRTIPFKNLSIIEKENGSSAFTKLVTHMGPYKHSHHALPLYHSIQVSLTQTILEYLEDKERTHAQT